MEGPSTRRTSPSADQRRDSGDSLELSTGKTLEHLD